MFRKTCIALMVVLMMASVSFARTYEGVDMPETIQDGDYTVVLNGVGIRVVLMVIKPYVGGLYLLQAEKDADTIMKANEPMAIRLQMTDSATRSLMLSKLYDGMRNSVASAGGNFDTLKDRFETFKSLLPDAKFEKGSIFEFKYLPSKGLQVYKNDQLKGIIEGADFKEAFFGIWLNKDKPADSGIKTAWLAGDVSQDALNAQKQSSAKVKIEKESRMADQEAKAKAVAEAEAQKKVEADTMKQAVKIKEAETTQVAKQPVMETAMKMTETKPAEKMAAKPAAAAMAAAVPMGADNALAAAMLVNALKSAELTAALNGDKFDMNKEAQKIIQMWKDMNQAISK